MRFFLDHDVPAEVSHLLRHWGHEVTLLKQALPIRASDEEAVSYARQNGLIIISCNRAHFMVLAKQAIQNQIVFPGLIILLRRRSRQSECAHLLQLLRRAGEIGLANNINFA